MVPCSATNHPNTAPLKEAFTASSLAAMAWVVAAKPMAKV